MASVVRWLNVLCDDGHRLSLGVRNPDGLIGTALDPAMAGPDRVQLVPYDAEDPAAATAWVEKAWSTLVASMP